MPELIVPVPNDVLPL
jgi:hypothetical protein